MYTCNASRFRRDVYQNRMTLSYARTHTYTRICSRKNDRINSTFSPSAIIILHTYTYTHMYERARVYTGITYDFVLNQNARVDRSRLRLPLPTSIHPLYTTR